MELTDGARKIFVHGFLTSHNVAILKLYFNAAIPFHKHNNFKNISLNYIQKPRFKNNFNYKKS